MLRVVVDSRETRLICEMQDRPFSSWTTKMLDLGDIHIVDSKGVVVCVIERKTWSDWAASIRDGRYREQKARMLRWQQTPTETKHKRCMYIVEGNIPSLQTAGFYKIGGMDVDTLTKSICSTILRDNVPVLFSETTEQTACLVEILVRVWGGTYTKKNTTRPSSIDYDTAVLLQNTMNKSANKTPNQCYLSQLAQLPGVSVHTAKILAAEYENMFVFCKALKNNGHKAVSYIRGIGPKTAGKIVTFMMNSKEEEKTEDDIGLELEEE